MKKIVAQLYINTDNKGVSTGKQWLESNGTPISSYSPVDGRLIGNVTAADRESYDAAIKKAEEAFTLWRMVPAPKRGEIVRQIGEALRQIKSNWAHWCPMKWAKACRRVMAKCRK